MNRDRVQELLLADRVRALALAMMRDDAGPSAERDAPAGGAALEGYVRRALEHLEHIAALIVPPGSTHPALPAEDVTGSP